MRLAAFLAAMEQIAPKELALGFDNPGYLIGTEKAEIARVLVALDCTPAVADEAAQGGYDLVLTHHPLFFHAVKHILPDDPETAAAYRLLRHGVGLFAAHTNLDAAEGGVSQTLAETVGITGIERFSENGIGCVGALATPMRLDELAALAYERLGAPVRYTGDGARWITRAAAVGGAGGSEILPARAAGAEAFLTGECAHHDALSADVCGLSVIACGHYETERIVLPGLIRRLQTITNDVQYQLAHSDHSPFSQA